MKSKSTRFAILAASAMAITFVHATDYDYTGASGGNWGLDTNWTATGVPVGTDSIVINKDIIATTTVNYAVSPDPATNRAITGISLTDTYQGFDDPLPANDIQSMFSYTFQPGVTGSQLDFSTNSPVVSTNIVNFISGAQRLTIQNPLFSQSDSIFSKNGVGNVRLEFLLAGGVTAFNSNVTGLSSDSTGDLWLTGPAGSTFNLPNTNFSSGCRLSVTGAAPVVVGSGISVDTGANDIYVGGGGAITFSAGSIFYGKGFVTSGNNSNYYYTGGNSTINWSGTTGTVNRLAFGEQTQANNITSALNIAAGTLTVLDQGNASYFGNPGRDGDTQTMNLNITGGTLAFTNATAGQFKFGQNTRNATVAPTTMTTINSTLTVSGTGILDMGTVTTLELGRRNATNSTGSANSTLNLNAGGLIRTAVSISRGQRGTTAGSASVNVFLNGGTIRTTAAVTNLFNNFVTANTSDGVYVSLGGAIIDTQAFNSGIAADLQENPFSLGGGLTKNGSGILTLSGGFATTGPTVVSSGNLRFNRAAGYTLNQTTSGSGTVGVQQGTVTVTSASFSPTGLTVGVGSNVLTPTVNWTGTGTIVQLSLNDQGATAKGTFNLNGGSVTVGGAASSAAYPFFYVNSLLIGGKGLGEFYINTGGTLTVNNGKRVIIGGLSKYGGTGTVQVGLLNVTGGLADLQGTSDLWVGYSQGLVGGGDNADFSGTGTVKLDGGILQTSRTFTEYNYTGGATTNNATSAVILNGGTLKAGATPNPDWIAAGNIDTVTTTGASVIDTNGQNMGISAAIGSTGSITKTGNGTLTLSGPNTYSGDTIVDAGTLAVGGSSIADTNKVVVNAGMMDLTGTEEVGTLYFGLAQQASGTWGASGSGATHIDNTRFSGTGMLSVTSGVSAGNYASWASANSVTGGPNGDSDNDGISNLVEYALDLDHTASDGAPGTLVGNTLTFNKRLEAYNNGDVTYVIEKSTDLGMSDPWTPVTPTTNTKSVISYDLSGPAAKNFARFSTTVTP